MALNVGQLLATMELDDRPFLLGLTASEAAMEGAALNAEQMGRRIRTSWDEALSELPEVHIDADASEADRELDALRQRLATMRDVHANLDVDAEQARAETDEVRARLVALADMHPSVDVQAQVTAAITALDATFADAQALAALDPTINVHADTAGATAHLAEVAAEAETVDHLDPEVNVRVDDHGSARNTERGIKSLAGSFFSALGAAGGFLRVPAMLTAAIPVAAGLATTLAQIAPAAAVGATAIVGAITAVGALKLGMHGVGAAITDAFDPTKAKRFDAALQALAPNARAFVRTLQGMKGPFHDLQQTVQQRMFAGLSADLRDLSSSALPVLRGALLSTASTFNGMAQGVMQTAAALADDGTLGRALRGATRGLGNLAGLPGIVVQALGELGAAAAPVFERMTAAAGQAAGRISARLETAFESGHLTDAINTAVNVLHGLATTVGDIGTVIGNVFKAAGAAGVGALGPFSQIAAILAKVSGTAAFQQGLTAIFGVIGDLSKTVLPLLGQALAVVAPVLTALAPPVNRLVDALGTALSPIIKALGPVLLAAADAVGALLDELDPLLPIIGQMIASLGPILTPILGVVGALFRAWAPVLLQLVRVLMPPFAKVVGTLSSAFRQLQPVLTTALDQLGTGLVPVVAALGVVIADLVDQYADQFMTMFEQLLPVIPLLVPLVVQLAESVAQVLTAVAPLLPKLMLMGAQMLTAVLPAVIAILPPLVELTSLLLVFATGVITKIVVPALKGLVAFLGGIRTALQPAIDAVTWLVTTISGLFEWLYDHLVGHSVIPDMVRAIVSWLAGLPGKALTALANLPGRIAGVAEDAAGRMVRAVRKGIGDAVSWLSGLPGKAKHALGDLGSTLWNSGQALIRGFIGGIKSMVGSAEDAVSGLVGKVADYFPHSPAKKGPLSGRGWVAYSGAAMGAAFATSLASQGDAVAAAAASLMGAAASPLGAGVAGSDRAGAAGFGGYGSGGGGQQTVRVVLDVQGGDEEFGRAIRKMVRMQGGGSVQAAFG